MRFCTNCGERLNEQQAFCPNCGTPVRAAQTQPAVTFEPSATVPDKPKKKMPCWLIAVICVVAVLLVAVLLLGYFLLGWFRAPHERLQNYLDKGSKLASAAILAREDNNAFSTDATLSLDAADVTLPADADATVYYLFGMDLATLLNAVSLDMNMDFDLPEKSALLEMALNLSGNPLMGYTFTADEEGIGAYASATDAYALATWDTIGVPFPYENAVSKEDLAELVTDCADAAKVLLTKESVDFERGYRMVCGDGEEVRCSRYVICPEQSEWEEFLAQFADLVESSAFLSTYVTSAYDSTMTASDVADSIREQAEEAAAQLADADATLELYMKGALPVGMSLSADDSETAFSITFAAHGNTSKGYRGMTVDAETYDAPVFSLQLDNAYAGAGDAETGELTGTVAMPDSDMTMDISGDYDGPSFDIAVNIKEGTSSYPLILKNECDAGEDTRKGTFLVSIRAPEEDGLLEVSADYDYSRKEQSVLHAPYGTFDISLDMKNLTYVYDDMLSDMQLTLSIGEGRNGGSDHRLTVKGLSISDELVFGDASIILSTSDEPTTARKPSVPPRYGDLSALEDVLTGGLPTNLW